MVIPDGWFLSLGREGQSLVDGALAAMGVVTVRWTGPELDLLTQYLDEGLLGDNTSQVERWIHAPTRSQLIEHVKYGDVDRSDCSAMRMALLAEAQCVFNQEPSHWDREPTGPVIAAIRGSGGCTGLLLYEIEHYGTGPYRWHGLFKGPSAIRAYLKGKGYLLDWEAVNSALPLMVEELRH